MNLFENWKNLIDKANAMKRKDLEAWRTLLIMLIVADLFGVFWYLSMKKLGLAIMMITIVGLAIILMLESKLPIESKKPKGGNKKMPEETEEKEEEQEEEKVDGLGFGDMDLGLPSAEEVNKGLKKATEFEGFTGF